MRSWAAAQDFYESPWGKHPRLQLFDAQIDQAASRSFIPSTIGADIINMSLGATFQRAANDGSPKLLNALSRA